MDYSNIYQMDEEVFYHWGTGKRVHLNPEQQAGWHKENLDRVVEDRKSFGLLGKLGKIGILYMGLRAVGLMSGIGPELNEHEHHLADMIGFTMTYLGGCTWFCGKLYQFTEERSARKDYEAAVSRLEEVAISGNGSTGIS